MCKSPFDFHFLLACMRINQESVQKKKYSSVSSSHKHMSKKHTTQVSASDLLNDMLTTYEPYKVDRTQHFMTVPQMERLVRTPGREQQMYVLSCVSYH